MTLQRSNIPFLIGADPEAFLVNQDGKLISSVGLIGGNKWAPRDMGNGFAIQEDNVAVEYNIPPVATAKAWVDAINHGLKLLQESVEKYGLKLAFQPSAVFTEDQLSTPQAQEFGCEPDFNAWTKRFNKRPNAKNKRLRSTGFHVHITSPADPYLLGQWCDVVLGVPSVLLDPDVQRRKLYGKAGAIRVKPYPGIEYRVLSSHFLSNDAYKYWIFEQVQRACQEAEAGKTFNRTVGSKIRKAINLSRKDLAEIMCAQFEVRLPNLGAAVAGA